MVMIMLTVAMAVPLRCFSLASKPATKETTSDEQRRPEMKRRVPST